MTEKMLQKVNRRAESEIASIIKEMESALKQVKFHRDRFCEAETAEMKAEFLDSINRHLRMMKSHINETALAYMAGLLDAEDEEAV